MRIATCSKKSKRRTQCHIHVLLGDVVISSKLDCFGLSNDGALVGSNHMSKKRLEETQWKRLHSLLLHLAV